jgi:hypothetical protein
LRVENRKYLGDVLDFARVGQEPTAACGASAWILVRGDDHVDRLVVLVERGRGMLPLPRARVSLDANLRCGVAAMRSVSDVRAEVEPVRSRDISVFMYSRSWMPTAPCCASLIRLFAARAHSMEIGRMPVIGRISSCETSPDGRLTATATSSGCGGPPLPAGPHVHCERFILICTTLALLQSNVPGFDG